MIRFINFCRCQNYVNRRRCILIVTGDPYLSGAWVRTYCSKREEIIDKLDALEQKIQKLVRKKAMSCLEAKCKEPDRALPDCRPGVEAPPSGRDEPVRPIPAGCDKPSVDSCIRPYVNPCPPMTVKPCSPFYRTVDPCRGPCPPAQRQPFDDMEIAELSIRKRQILLALTTLLAIAIIYKLLRPDTDEEKGHNEVVSKKRRFKKPKQFLRDPMVSSDLPNHVQYLIVGGGPAAYSVLKTLSKLDENARILVVNKEPCYPYDRTPLSTELVSGKEHVSEDLKYVPRAGGKQKSVYFENNDLFFASLRKLQREEPGFAASVARGWAVARVDSDKKCAYLEDGKKISYEKCVLATGSSPKQLRVFADVDEEALEKVSTFTSIYDYQVLEALIDYYGDDFTLAIVGGGFNGTELASSLRGRGINVIQIFRENGVMRHILPGYLSDWLTDKMSKLGVRIVNNATVEDAYMCKDEGCDGRIALQVGCGKKKKTSTIYADHVLVSVGHAPNTQLAEASGIEVDRDLGGFLVNRELQIRSDLYGAGDCISFYDGKFGRRHIEHYDHAMESGKVVAENLMGKKKSYDTQTILGSDVIPDLSYEALGVIDSKLPTVGIYVKEDEGGTETIKENTNEGNEEGRIVEPKKYLEDFYKGVIFYLRNETVVGVLAWNVFDRAPQLRKILEMNKGYDDVEELAKYLSIHI